MHVMWVLASTEPSLHTPLIDKLLMHRAANLNREDRAQACLDVMAEDFW